MTAQNVNFNSIRFQGLKFYSSKKEIVGLLGEPEKLYEPNYACGGLSADWQGKPFETMEYVGIKFTGNNEDHYLIEEIDFSKNNELTLFYGPFALNGETNVNDLIDIFGDELEQLISNKKQDQIILIQTELDDGLRFVIIDNKLARIEYWTSC